MEHAERRPPRRRQAPDPADTTSLADTTPDRFLTRPEVEKRTGLSRSTIYHLMAMGQFPRPYRVGLRGVRWSLREVDEWAASRPRSHGDRKRVERAEHVTGAVQATARNNSADDA